MGNCGTVIFMIIKTISISLDGKIFSSHNLKWEVATSNEKMIMTEKKTKLNN